MVLVVIAFVRVVNVLAGVMLVTVALVDVVDMARLVPVMLVVIAFVDVMNVLAGVVFVLVALVRVMMGTNHSGHLTQECMESIPSSVKPDGLSLYQKLPAVKPISRNSLYNSGIGFWFLVSFKQWLSQEQRCNGLPVMNLASLNHRHGVGERNTHDLYVLVIVSGQL